MKISTLLSAHTWSTGLLAASAPIWLNGQDEAPRMEQGVVCMPWPCMRECDTENVRCRASSYPCVLLSLQIGSYTGT